MAGTIDLDTLALQVAAGGHGACTRADLLGNGLTPGAIGQRVAAGMLRPTHRGVYVVDQLTDHLTPLYAAALAVRCGVISHESAAEVHDQPIDPGSGLDPLHLSVPARTRRRPMDGVVIHRRRVMPQAEDVTIIDGLPVTTPARTIVDLAACVTPGRLRHVIQTQVGDDPRLVDELMVCFAVTARRGLKGSAVLRRLLASMFDDRPIVRSELEARTLALLRANGMGDGVAQFRPPWYDGVVGVVDFAWPEVGVVLEADGRRWHQRDQDFTADRRRDRLAAAHGWTTIRVTWEEVAQRPAATAAEIAAVLATRRAGPAPSALGVQRVGGVRSSEPR